MVRKSNGKLSGTQIIPASTPNMMFFVYDFHSDDTCDLGDALKRVTVLFPYTDDHGDVQITLAMLSNV